jgi:hypothetical protein
VDVDASEGSEPGRTGCKVAREEVSSGHWGHCKACSGFRFYLKCSRKCIQSEIGQSYQYFSFQKGISEIFFHIKSCYAVLH